jgi:hypothetical protein
MLQRGNSSSNAPALCLKARRRWSVNSCVPTLERWNDINYFYNEVMESKIMIFDSAI